MASRSDHNHAPERPGGIRGKYAVFATLSLFIIVPAISVTLGLMLTGGSRTLELDYADRADWFVQPAKPRPLKYSKFVAAETGKQYKKTDLTVDPAVEERLRRCVRLAQADDFAQSTATRDTLEQYAADPANGFYPPYLLAAWHRLNGNPTQYREWIRAAFDRADGAICQRFVDKQGQPVAGYAIPPVAIGYDRVTDGKLDATLFLVYPGLVTGERGYIYLPTFRSVYRLTDPNLPLGSSAKLHPTRLTLLPQPPNGTDPNWFAVPDGAVGQLPDAVVEPTD